MHKALRYILSVNESQMTLGTDWAGQDPAGWIASEKLDGCRAYWDGSQFWTRSGKIINAPALFIAGLPACHLDGEIWAGRGGFDATSDAVRFGRFSPKVQFAIFAFPTSEKIPVETEFAFTVKNWIVESRRQMIKDLLAIKSQGGEGL
jgi:DNA ligase 1